MATTKILPAVRLVEITKELRSLSLDGLEGAPLLRNNGNADAVAP